MVCVRSVVCGRFVFNNSLQILTVLGRLVDGRVGGNVLQCSVQRLVLKALENMENDIKSDAKGSQLEPKGYHKWAKG